MKRILLSLVATLLCSTTLTAQELPSRGEILEVMKRANDYLMQSRYPDPTAVMPYPSRKRNYESNIWTRAVYYEGLMALYSISPENRSASRRERAVLPEAVGPTTATARRGVSAISL